jgi:hypothetical protein
LVVAAVVEINHSSVVPRDMVETIRFGVYPQPVVGVEGIAQMGNAQPKIGVIQFFSSI